MVGILINSKASTPYGGFRNVKTVVLHRLDHEEPDGWLVVTTRAHIVTTSPPVGLQLSH